ncbi:hypothetical protein [Deinococcus ficus]|uniref:hypothetical protein n=1 Tax=Deinococcus ficus TaxID=317577 RepID=UPI000488D1AA|nr:hypothetical protein [Deinococcus ficus]
MTQPAPTKDEPAAMDPVRLVRDVSVTLEGLLAELGAEGNGLGEKARSLPDLPDTTQQQIRRIAYLRNRVMHDGFDPPPHDLEQYLDDARRARSTLSTLAGRPEHGTAAAVRPEASSEFSRKAVRGMRVMTLVVSIVVMVSLYRDGLNLLHYYPEVAWPYYGGVGGLLLLEALITLSRMDHPLVGGVANALAAANLLAALYFASSQLL